MKLMLRHRVVSKRVVTWFWCCDLAWGWAGETVSRPGLALRPSRSDFNVATWASGYRKDSCRDIILRSRHRRSGWGRLPGRVATSARLACARPAHAERVNCAGCARDMHTTWALRA